MRTAMILSEEQQLNQAFFIAEDCLKYGICDQIVGSLEDVIQSA